MAVRALTRREIAALFAGACLNAQKPVEWVCPMDPDVRAIQQGKCRKCGMALVAGLPTPEEYPVEMTTTREGSQVTFRFRILQPKTRKLAKLQLIHEKLFHLFLISRDLEDFRHEHPELQADGSFLYQARLEKPGMYRVLCDFYPENATPQMIPKTLLLPGDSKPATLKLDLSPKAASNLRVTLRTEPEQPLAGTKTMLFFDLDPADGLEQYLGAWGHMLVASEDLIDLVHNHPAWEDAGPNVQFNLIFPRAEMHRIWVQFQRKGVVNTAAFNVAIQAV